MISRTKRQKQGRFHVERFVEERELDYNFENRTSDIE